MKITAYPLSDQAVAIEPAPNERAWTIEIGATVADLALSTAGGRGWDLLCPYAVEAIWNGGPSPEDITIRIEAPERAGPAFVQSCLGGGLLTFYPGYQFQTEGPNSLWVRGPINAPKDGLYPLEEVVDTSLLPCTVAIQWQFTRPNQTIRFAAGEPFGTILPYPKSAQENVTLDLVLLDDDVDAYEQAFQQMIDDPTIQNLFQRLGATPAETTNQESRTHTPVSAAVSMPAKDAPHLRRNGVDQHFLETTGRIDQPYKIGLLTIATGKYQRFVAPLYESVDQFFFKSHQVQKFLFTDNRDPFVDVANTIVCPIPHSPWPLVTLLRYHFFLQYSSLLSTMDYLFYCDADMRFTAECGEEMLPDTRTGLVGVEHIAYYTGSGRRGTYETNPISTAYVASFEGNSYYCGGVNGGTSDAFLRMARQLVNNINQDLRKNYIALWQDESHLNRYFIDHPPKTLSPSYVHPEGENKPFPKIILALNKNHDEIRSW